MRAILLLLLLLTISGCAQDPYQRPGTWSLPPAGLGANDTNLRAMVVNPDDLAAGTGDDSSTGPLSVRPVDALVSGHRKLLPTVNATSIGTGGQQGAGGQGAGGPGGGGAQ